MAPDDIDTTPLRAATDSSLRPQTLLLHTYEVEQLLASGGMGEVYLAHHAELGTRHAVKVIKPGLTGGLLGTDVLELFRREAMILRGIRNDAVVGYESFFRDEQRNFYLVMEYVDGPSLAQILTERSLSLKEVFQLRDRLCKGLAAVHEKGVVHRDLSPDNVILPGGDVNAAKLIDFGIAKLNDPGHATIIGSAFVGKLRYAAPEQLGLFRGKVSPATDIYSLGLVLTAAILGAPSYGGDSIQQVLEARQKLPDLRAVPAVLRPQLIAMLQPNPADRPQRTPDLLKRWPYPPAPSPAKVVKEPRAGSPEFGKRFWNYRIPLLVLGVGIALALGLGFFLRHTVKPPTAPMVDRIPLPKPAETATESGQPPARSAEPELNSAPPATPELKEIPVTPAPEVTSVGRQPAAPPVEPAPEEPPNTPAAASIGPQPAAPPAELDVPKIVPTLKKKPPTAKGSPQTAPKSPPPVPSTPAEKRATSEAGGPQTLSSRPDEGSKRRRCGDILARVTLGESLSNEDRTFLTKECR